MAYLYNNALETRILSYVSIGSYKDVFRYASQISAYKIYEEHFGKTVQQPFKKTGKLCRLNRHPSQDPHEWKIRHNEQPEKLVNFENKTVETKNVVDSENKSVAPEPKMVEMEVTIYIPNR